MISAHAIDDTIIALATAQGVSAIAVIRLSGKESIRLANQLFKGKNLQLKNDFEARGNAYIFAHRKGN